jgi:putative membrane protein
MKLLIGLALTGLAFAQGDAQFARDAAQGGMMEVQLGKLATTNGSSPIVKSLGQRLADDHKKAADDLKSVASKNNWTLPTSLDAKHQAMVDKMAKLTGSDFDQAYLSDMVKDHQGDIADFQREVNSGSNMDLKTWATQTLPTIQDHLRAIKEAQTSMTSMK